MNEDVDLFITSVFSDELVSLIRKSFSLFQAFDHQTAYQGFVEIVMDESFSDTSGRCDRFTTELTAQLDYILRQHLMVLSGPAGIQTRVTILTALYELQYLEDYTIVETILQSTRDSIDKMALVLAQLTNMDEGAVLEVLEHVDDMTLKKLQQLIDQKNAGTPPPETIDSQKVVKRMREFNTVLGSEHIAQGLIEAGILLGCPLATYLPFVDESIVAHSDTQTALNIMALISLSNEADAGILQTYREVGLAVLIDPALVARVETQVIRLLGKITEYRQAHQ